MSTYVSARTFIIPSPHSVLEASTDSNQKMPGRRLSGHRVPENAPTGLTF